ncbi:transcription factor TFIIIB component B'' homolog isoform X2 [Tachysurus fulvidraco]|uniref:transcription factor TFIIIB component B'' homolog isoform X2 n=1 Tax=Tachysurus fulvidraco TaxID=1234273 RepID=UPI001FEEA6B6|nr:transcription factor TFIIIB component B'' homolog isoform X2 [Tachysurus fulvidraco]
MIRRSRISVRPNVKPTGRAAVTSREAPRGNEAPADLGANVEVKDGAQENVTDVTEAASTVLAAETNDNTESQRSDVIGQSDLSSNTVDVAGQSVSTSSLSMRRKRFNVLPNLSKPRSTPSSTLTPSKLRKSPARPVTTPEIPSASTHIAAVVSESPDKHEPAQEPAPELLSVSIKSVRPSAPKLPPSSVHSTSRTSRFHTETTKSSPEKVSCTPESAPELPHAPLAPSEGKSKRRKPKPVTSARDKKETLSCTSDKAEPQSANQDASESSCPSKEVCSPLSASLSESLNEPVVQDGSDLSSPGESNKPQHVPLALRTLNDPVDRLRLARAKKLRELLKKEMKKEKKHQRSQTGISKSKKTKDHTKMTMRELIYYLPSTNPMKSHTEDEQRAETDFPPSPNAAPAVQPVTDENTAEEEEEREEEGEEEEEPMLAPRVKVAEDGSLIIDEESLTVRVQRMKGPNPVEERDPIFERGSTTTYSSFRKGTYTKPWSNRETDLFFLAISMVGTDFSMIGQLFPHRARTEIKNKFKKEERANSWRIDKAFKEKRGLDLDFFSKLLAQILKNDEETRKKKKRTSEMSKLPRRRPEERKRIYSSDSEEESSSGDAMDGEKENEIARNDGGSSATPKRRRTEASQKRTEQEAEEEDERFSDEETALVNGSDPVGEGEAESFGAKPPRRRRNGGPVVRRKALDTHTSVREEHTKESDTHDPSASVPEKTRHDPDVVSCGLQDSENEEEPDVSVIQEHILNKPTRSGRIPKLSQQMIRAAADEEDNEEEEQLPTLPLTPDGRTRGSRAKRGRFCPQRQGKSRLLTLRASVAEDEDNVEEEYGTNQEEENYPMNAEEENQAFVPMGLRSVRSVQSEVEETMEELDISVNVPDVLGISQNAVCPESSCERALASMGSVPCEHQLDLLVGVIDFLPPDNMEVSEEAARTLLTIGHSADVTQTGDLSNTGDVIIVEESSTPVQEVLMETMDQSETVEFCDVVTSDPSFSITSQPDSVSSISMEAPSPLQDFAFTVEPIGCQESKLLSIEIQAETSNVTVPDPTASKTRRNHLPEPKPNLSRASNTTQRGPAGAVDSSTETCSTPGKHEAQTSTVKVFSPEEPSRPRSEEQNSEVCKERDSDKTEACSPVVLMGKKMEDGDSGQRSFGENVRKEETRQAHGDSEPRSSDSEHSARPSQLVRRCRGPRAKPNLVRSVRTAHAVTHIQQNRPAVPDEKQAGANRCTGILLPDEGANVGPQPGTPNNPLTVNPDEEPEEPPRSSCETLTSDEPVYILSLTEVLPTLAERAGLVTECIAFPATSGMISEPMNVIEDATADVGGAGPDGDQVISQLLPDALIPVSEEGDAEKRGNETSRRREEESSSQLRRREHSPLTQNMPAPEGLDQPPEHLASRCTTEENVKEVDRPTKRRTFPERGRRGKLQLEPNTIQRTNRGDETRSAPPSSREMKTSEETEPHPAPSEITTASASTSTEGLSSAILEEEEEDEALSLAASPSQGNVENINFPGTDLVEPGACGVEVGSQPVHQTPPLASTGPLTRPGRRPKGFLSFMSSANTQRPSESTRPTTSKPAVVASRRGRRQATPCTSTQPPALPSASPQPSPQPPPSLSPPPLPSASPQPPHVSSHAQASTSSENPSVAEANEEPTSVSAYFFNDIFTVVEEQDELD